MPSFTHGRLTMAIHQFGNGPLPLLAIHGFDRSGREFSVLAASLASQCTFHAFDLPFHGQSPAPAGDEAITPEEFAAYFTAYAAHIGGGELALLGYSLGGRLALCLAEQCPTLWKHIFLLAPDGLVSQPWYRGMAKYRWGRWVYRKFIDHPGGIHALIALLYRTRLIGDRMHRFLMGHSDTKQARVLLHEVWTRFRLIEPDLKRVAANLRAQALPLHLFMGEHDRVIRPKQAKRLEQLAPKEVHVKVMPTGHRMLTAELGVEIARRLLPQWAPEGNLEAARVTEASRSTG